jgi:hypothetical protein
MEWLCWVESANAAPAGGFPATDGDPVRCPNCGVDMRVLEADHEQLHVSCDCGVTVSGFYLEEICGGRLRTRRREPGAKEWLVSWRRNVLLESKRREAPHAR